MNPPGSLKTQLHDSLIFSEELPTIVRFFVLRRGKVVDGFEEPAVVEQG